MWDLWVRFFRSKTLRFFLKVIGSIASAVMVLSGFLFWQNQQKTKSSEGEEEEEPGIPKKDNVCHLRRK